MSALALYDANEIEAMSRVAKAMAISGMFQDATDVSKAFVKIQAGKELGIPAFASMTSIHVIKGKPVIGANMIATLIKNDPRYDYKIKKLDNKECVIAFFENGERVEDSSFTIDDAKAAGLLTNTTWQKYPRNMLFSRAISNGARWYTPGIFGGSPVYTPDEMGVSVDEDGYILEQQQPTPEPAPEATPEPTPEVIEDGDFTEEAYVDIGPDPFEIGILSNCTDSDYQQIASEFVDQHYHGDHVGDLMGVVADRFVIDGESVFNGNIFHALGSANKMPLLVDAGKKLQMQANCDRSRAEKIVSWLIKYKANPEPEQPALIDQPEPAGAY